jgi:apolipoprotein N-acyltransferase
MVCYESIFPEYVSSYVKRGAEFLIFITNDSWWGNTSGARQHNRYAVLRAVENRRWVVRCANGGISSFIDPRGTMYDATPMYTEASIHHRIGRRTDLTFYAKHGDWLARCCAVVCVLLILTALFRSYTGRRAMSKRLLS